MKKMTIIRYSESFKIEAVRHYERSGLSKKQTMEFYGIKGGATLNNWLRKYGNPSSQNRIIRVEKPDEKNRIKSLKDENDKLKKALADAHMKQITSENFLEAVSELMGISVEELKKKSGE